MFKSMRSEKLEGFVGSETRITGLASYDGHVGVVDSWNSGYKHAMVRLNSFYMDDHDFADGLSISVPVESLALQSDGGNTFLDKDGRHYCDRCTQELKHVKVEITTSYTVMLSTLHGTSELSTGKKHVSGSATCTCGHECIIPDLMEKHISVYENLIRESVHSFDKGYEDDIIVIDSRKWYERAADAFRILLSPNYELQSRL